MQEMCTGVLLCSILNFHQPKLNILQGLNTKARVKMQCINNIEKAIQVLYNKSVPVRFIPTADEIFEAEKNQSKIWLLLKMIFDHFAMQDVYKLTPYIIKWLSLCLLYSGSQF